MSVYTGGAGQTCVAGSRILVHNSIYDEMLDRMVAVAKRIKLGDPMDTATTMGPLAFDGQFAKVTGYLELGRRRAPKSPMAAVMARPYSSPARRGRGLFRPADSVRRRQERHANLPGGNIRAGRRVLPFRDEEEAVAIANDLSYGLACGLWTNDLKRAHRLAAGSRSALSGSTPIAIHWAVPFGGVKDSGYGRDSGLESLRGYQRSKAVWVDLT